MRLLSITTVTTAVAIMAVASIMAVACADGPTVPQEDIGGPRLAKGGGKGPPGDTGVAEGPHMLRFPASNDNSYGIRSDGEGTDPYPDDYVDGEQKVAVHFWGTGIFRWWVSHNLKRKDTPERSQVIVFGDTAPGYPERPPFGDSINVENAFGATNYPEDSVGTPKGMQAMDLDEVITSWLIIKWNDPTGLEYRLRWGAECEFYDGIGFPDDQNTRVNIAAADLNGDGSIDKWTVTSKEPHHMRLCRETDRWNLSFEEIGRFVMPLKIEVFRSADLRD
jgi:hypothetical protein